MLLAALLKASARLSHDADKGDLRRLCNRFDTPEHEEAPKTLALVKKLVGKDAYITAAEFENYKDSEVPVRNCALELERRS